MGPRGTDFISSWPLHVFVFCFVNQYTLEYFLGKVSIEYREFSHTLKKKKIGGGAQAVKLANLDLRVTSLSPRLGMEPT